MKTHFAASLRADGEPGSTPIQGASTQDQLRQRNVFMYIIGGRVLLVVALIAILAS